MVRPKAALLQVNRYCNLACPHCFQSAPFLQNAADSMEISTQSWIDILSNLRSVGIKRVRFTGGEPFLRKDIENLFFAALDMEPSFLTNALAILPHHIKWLEKLRPKIIWVSIYGYPEAVYENITGNPGSFARCRRAIESLVAASIPVGLYYPLGNSNARDIGAFLLDSYRLGVRQIKIIQVLPLGRAVLEGGRLRPLPQSYLQHILEDIIAVAPGCPGLTVKVGMDSGQKSLFRSKGFAVPEEIGCGAGLRNFWTVDSRGQAFACCLMLGQPGASLLDARSLKQCMTWHEWGLPRTLRRMGIADDPTKICPVLISRPDPSKGNDFICPLTYAEISS